MTKFLSVTEFFAQKSKSKPYSYHSLIDFGCHKGKRLGELIRTKGWVFAEEAMLNEEHFFLDEELFNDYQEFYVSNHEVIEAQEKKKASYEGPQALIKYIKSKRVKQ